VNSIRRTPLALACRMKVCEPSIYQFLANNAAREVRIQLLSKICRLSMADSDKHQSIVLQHATTIAVARL